MRTSLLTKVYTKLWWLQIILGAIFIAFGVCIVLIPKESYVNLSVFFAIAILLTGVFEITRSVKNRPYSQNWKWYFFGGIVDSLVGLIFLGTIELTMQLLPMVLGSWIVFRGMLYIVLSLEVKRSEYTTWYVLLFFGILIIAMGMLILIQPRIGTYTIVYATSIAFIFTGIFRVTLGRSLYQHRLR